MFITCSDFNPYNLFLTQLPIGNLENIVSSVLHGKWCDQSVQIVSHTLMCNHTLLLHSGEIIVVKGISLRMKYFNKSLQIVRTIILAIIHGGCCFAVIIYLHKFILKQQFLSDRFNIPGQSQIIVVNYFRPTSTVYWYKL